MSYREVRNFIEMTRALGYPHLISMESFRKPNFRLIADLLLWLSKRFDPDCDIQLMIDTEDERIKFIRQIAEFMVLKANIKLNTKRLYQADGYAIKELLKIITILYEALNLNENGDNDTNNNNNSNSFDDDHSLNLNDFDLNDKVNELKLTRQLASEITASGATLFDLLGKENELRSARQKSLGRQFELNDIEDGIKKAIESIKNEITDTKQLIDNVSVSEANLDSKIERRKVEIDRYEKRLQTLKKVRPAFLEEFTELEAELEQLFNQYSLRLRILNQLQRQFNESERTRLEKQLQLTSPRIEPIPLEGGNDDVDDDDVFLDNLTETKPTRQDRPRASTGGRSRTGKGGKAYGSMQPPISATPSLSSETETDDELFIDKDESELMHSDDESMNLEISEIDKRAAQSKSVVAKLQTNSDDEF